MNTSPCPKCSRVTLSWNDQQSAWSCRSIDCVFQESEREHFARLRAEGGGPTVPDETLYVRCPTCAGSLVVPGAIMNSFACACTTTKTPGFVPCARPGTFGTGPFTRTNLSALQTDHDRLLVALWEVASIDEDSEAAYKAASHVHGRQTGVYVALRNLNLPLPDPEKMALPDHEGYKARRDARATHAQESPHEPDGPPADTAEVVADLREQLKVSDLANFAEVKFRERLEAALAKTHVALGGDGEWRHLIMGRHLPPNTGDLAADVPALAENVHRGLVLLRAEARQRIADTTTFGQLSAGDHFIEAPQPGSPARTCRLYEKVATVASERHATGYNTRDHATGVLGSTADAVPVIPVSLGDFGKREPLAGQ
jgi:hypothetical protein